MRVDEALRLLLEGAQASGAPISAEAVAELVARDQAIPAATEVTVPGVCLASFDELYTCQVGGNDPVSAVVDVKTELVSHLRALHLPTVRRCYEEVARHAEQETLSYERYLLELTERECQERKQQKQD